MYNHWIIALITMTIAFSIPIICNDQTPLIINSLTKNIYHRFYLINRLEDTLDIMKKTYADSEICYANIQADFFKHPIIQEIAQSILYQKNISKLLQCWEHFTAYRYINDSLFESEFIHLVLIICHHMAPDEPSCKKSIPTVQNVDTDSIANTFYVIQRIQKPIEVLCKLYEQSNNVLMSNATTTKKSVRNFFNEEKEFNHDRIQDCIGDIYTTNSIEPLKKTYKEFAQYRYAGDDAFLREQLSLIFFAYKLMLNKTLSNQTEQVIIHEMQNIQYITHNIDIFSIDQILASIDIMTDKLSTINRLETIERNKFQKKLNLLGASLALIAVSIPVIYTYLQS